MKTELQNALISNDLDLIKRTLISAHRNLYDNIINALKDWNINGHDLFISLKKEVFAQMFGDIKICNYSFGCHWVKVNGNEMCCPCLFDANFCRDSRHINHIYDNLRYDLSSREDCMEIAAKIRDWDVK